MAATNDAKAKTAKGKSKPKGKQAAPAVESTISVAAHPRAGAQVRRAKGWGGLAGFTIGGYLSIKAGVPVDQAGERAIAAGATGYVLAWGCSVTIWRQLVQAELRHAAEHARRRRAEAAAGVMPPHAHEGS